MKWLFFLTLAFTLVVHIVSVMPLVEATPRHKTVLQGTKHLIQPSTQAFSIHLSLYYRRNLIKKLPLAEKTVQFYLGRDSSQEEANQLLGSAISDANGDLYFSEYTPPIGTQIWITAKFKGDADFNPCKYEIKVKRLNVLPFVTLQNVQTDNRSARISWEGSDVDGTIEAYRYKLDRPYKIDLKWSEWSLQNQVTYSDLKPGKYTLHVQARDQLKGVSEIMKETFSIEEKIIQLLIQNQEGQAPPFTVKQDIPIVLQAYLQENQKEKQLLTPIWHCYRGKYQNGVYQCSLGGIEDLVVVEDPASGKITFFKINVEY